MQFFSLLCLFTATSSATKMLLPLYQYPDGSAYDTVYSTVEAHPQLDFQIILNVDSGPGGPQPDDAFTTATAKLTSYSNVKLLGYLHCEYGAASTSDVAQNSSDWAAWNTYTGANLSIDGLFFDETPNSEGTTGNDDVTFMQSVVESARSAFGAHEFISMFNPGSAVEHTEYWTLADYNVVFEDDASAYSNSILTTNIPAGKANQSSILIPEFASVGSESEAQSWLEAMVQAGVGSAHILNYGYIDALSSTEPAAIGVIAVALASNDGDTSSTSATAAAASSTAVAPSNTEVAPSPVETASVTEIASGSSTSAPSDEDVPTTTTVPIVVQTSFVTKYTTEVPTATPTSASTEQDSDGSRPTSGARPTGGRGHRHHHNSRAWAHHI